MNAIVDPWGIDDIVIAEIDRDRYGESEAMTWWMAMLTVSQPADVILDLGSYTGLYSLLAASYQPERKVVAVEASAVTYSRLMQNVLSNGFDTRILPHNYALSDSSGVLLLSHAYGVTAMASGESLLESPMADHKTAVVSISLDGLLLQPPDGAVGPIGSTSTNMLPISGIGAAKIDVEGVEADVLRGAESVLSRFRPPLIIEVLEFEKLRECLAVLEPLGYEMIEECPGSNFIFSSIEHKTALVNAFDSVRTNGSSQFQSSVKLAYVV
jgi:FkbM family methyltransferase